MRLYTSYFGNYRRIPAEYQCISIANSKPTNLPVPTWYSVVPNWRSVESLKAGTMNWHQFSMDYYTLLSRKIYYKDDILRYFTEYTSCDGIVFLCWEKDRVACHRSILANYLQDKLRIAVQELK